MQRLAFYGKGGIGKSTIAASLSAIMARSGKRVLHVGCDPKHDSTVSLMGGAMIPTVVNQSLRDVIRPEEIVSVSPLGVHCVEAGGPHAGVGCAGRGISRTLEIFDRADLLSSDRYDVVSFDILGDVVCGGFAAPLRHRVGEKVIIVASEEVMSLYAANNIAKAVLTYASNGIVCAGMVINLRDNNEDLAPAERFAKLLGVRILGVGRRDPIVREAEYQRITVVQHAPDSQIVAELAKLAETILSVDPKQCRPPTPLSDEDFYAYTRRKFRDSAEGEPPVVVEAAVQDMSAQPSSAEQGATEQDDKRRRFKRELRAGIAAVKRGLLQPEEAVERLQASYPEFTRSLRARDLMR